MGDKAEEIFVEGRIAKDILAGLGGDNKKTVKKKNPYQGG